MAAEIFIPKMGANIDKVEIGKIRVKEGDEVKKGDILFEIITDKATFDVESDAAGTILKLSCKEGDELNVLEVVGFIGEKGEDAPRTEAKTVKATPGAKKLAKEKGIDLESKFSGSGRVIREADLQGLLGEDKIEIEKQSFRKKKEIENLSRSRENICSAVTVQVSALKTKRKVNDYSKGNNARLSMCEYISYNAACALREFPKLNAYYSEKGLCVYRSVNIGIAMSPEDDLLVPIVRDADKLSLIEFSERFTELLMKTLKNELKLQELEGGTFTVTDLSAYGVFDFIPVINANQSAILAISSEHDSCREEEGKLVYDPKINLTVAFDHRATEGKYALNFLQKLKSLIE